MALSQQEEIRRDCFYQHHRRKLLGLVVLPGVVVIASIYSFLQSTQLPPSGIAPYDDLRIKRDKETLPKLNLVFILTDQQRYDAISRMQKELGVPKKSRIRTPNLDKLSMEGAFFRNAYTHCPVCVPARTSLLTGRTIQHTGVRTNFERTEDNIHQPGVDAGRKIPQIRTYDEILVQDHGYVAEYYGKWHTTESKGFVYDNDVRSAGQDFAWFGKYETDNVTKHESVGMGKDYQEWLKENTIKSEGPLMQGEQIDRFSHLPYTTDPLDARFGKPPGYSGAGIKSISLQGKSCVPDGFSITCKQGTEALEALQRLHHGGTPFSLHLSFQSPHPPMVPTEKYYQMYDPSNMIVPESISDPMSDSAYVKRRDKIKSDELRNHSSVQRWIATYYGLVTEVDEWVGLIMQKIEDLGIANTTLVVFASDHGEMLGGHGMMGKSVFYEESTRVPLMMRLPGKISRGTIVDTPVSLIDLHSTVLEYLQVQKSYKTDGSSLHRYIERTDNLDEDSFVVALWDDCASKGSCIHSEPGFMIRKGEWKLMLQRKDTVGIDMLYNLKEDPMEMKNLLGLNAANAPEHVIGKAEHLKALLVKYLIRTGHPARNQIAKHRRKWRSLDLWVGDSILEFRALLHDGTRTEWLYLGTSRNETVPVNDFSIEGAFSKHYRVKWETNDEFFEKHQRVLAVTYDYSGPDDDCSDSVAHSTTLILRCSRGGVDKNMTVALRGPQRGECRRPL